MTDRLCEWCKRPLPAMARRDRKYCSISCRQMSNNAGRRAAAETPATEIPDRPLPWVESAIRALDRLSDAMHRAAPEAEIAPLRAAYERAEQRLCDQIDALCTMVDRLEPDTTSTGDARGVKGST